MDKNSEVKNYFGDYWGEEYVDKFRNFLSSKDLILFNTEAKKLIHSMRLDKLNTFKQSFYEFLDSDNKALIDRISTFEGNNQTDTRQVVTIGIVTNIGDEKKTESRLKLLRQTILSLKNLDNRNWELIVFINSINNTFRDEFEEFIRTNLKNRFLILGSSRNLGLAAGRNIIISNTGVSTYMNLFLDDDVYINDSGLLDKLLIALNENKCAFAGPQVVYHNKRVLENGMEFLIEPMQGKMDLGAVMQVDFLEGSCHGFRTDLLRELIICDLYPNHYNYYWEEVLPAWKFWNIYNLPNILVKNARVIHLRDGGGLIHPHSFFFYIRNFLFLLKDINIYKKLGFQKNVMYLIKILKIYLTIILDKKDYKLFISGISGFLRGLIYRSVKNN